MSMKRKVKKTHIYAASVYNIGKIIQSQKHRHYD